MNRSPNGTYLIGECSQLELMSSPIRHEILSAASALGPCSASEIASEVGVVPNALYYHLRKLVKAELLVSGGSRDGSRRSEELYVTPARSMQIAHDPTDGRAADVTGKAVGAVLRAADRDFFRASGSDAVVTSGAGRNLGGGRVSGWFTTEEVRELNEHLAGLEAIVRRARRRRGPAGRRLHAFTWLFAPVASKR